MIVESDFLTHWKTRTLVQTLDYEAAPLCVLRLWAHCQQRRTDRLENNPTILASICGYAGDALRFHQAMQKCRFIEVADEKTLVVHDWAETNAILIGRWKGGESTKKRYSGVPGGTASARAKLPAKPGAKLPAHPTGKLELNESLARADLELSQSEKRREEKNKNPLPSPETGGQPQKPENVLVLNTSPAEVMIVDENVAKTLICEKILNGRNPARAWSYDAQVRLADLCNEGSPMPLSEILAVARYRAIPFAEDVPELAKRLEPITETGLMRYWGDEVQRALAYFLKYDPIPKKKIKEPPRWREFFKWKYGDEIRLVAAYELLGKDQKQEYEKDYETFTNRNGG